MDEQALDRVMAEISNKVFEALAQVALNESVNKQVYANQSELLYDVKLAVDQSMGGLKAEMIEILEANE